MISLEELWHELKIQCAATKPTDEKFKTVSKLVMVSKEDLKQALKRVRKNAI